MIKTIKIADKTKKLLDGRKMVKRDTYDEIINRLIKNAKP